jgi:uncharacterized membrane protein
MDTHKTSRDFPRSFGILFGLGLGGFFDGLFCIRSCNGHMLTSDGYTANSLHNLQVNMLWDGLFHLFTYIFVLFGLIILWKRAHRTHVRWSGKLLTGTSLMGFGIFNVVEGMIDHHILRIHHVNETVSHDQWIIRISVSSFGCGMLLGCWFLLKTGEQQTPAVSAVRRA